MRAYQHFILAILAIAGTLSVSAQSTTQSAYSRIGYGMLGENATGVQRQMGGVGYAMPGKTNVNNMNPASYAATDSLTFLWEIGADVSQLWAKENGTTGTATGGGLDYINAQFRVARNVGMSFGLVPFSSVGYSFGNDIDNGTESRTGLGSLSELYLGAAWSPIKNFSFGANVSYLFGTLENNTVITSSGSTGFTRQLEVRDWNLHVGAQYFHNISRKDRVGIGVMFSPKKSFHGNTCCYQYNSQDVDSDGSFKIDTVASYDMKNNYEKPNTYGVGISYAHSQNLFVEADFTYQDWSKAKYTTLPNFEPTNMKFDNRWKAALGVQYVPDVRGSYFKRIAYRAGGYFNHDYQNVMGNNVRDYGVSLGVGLPALGSKSVINLGVEWKHRYSAPTTLIKEDYLNITLSITFNEMWFWKNKLR